MDGLQLLKKDHDKVRELFEEFRQASEAGDVDTMRSLTEEIFEELEVHSAIEEEVLYPATKGMGEDLSDTTSESLEEHHVVDVLMEEIRRLDPDDEAYTAKMMVLIENVEHHAQEEEEEMFPQVREHLDEGQLRKLGEDLAAAKERHQQAMRATG
jgi:hemerythrin superfamily protein